MPSTLKNTSKGFADDNEEVSGQVILDSEAGPSRHPLRSKKLRQNMPYARTKKNLERNAPEEEGGFLNSVKSILSLKWLRNSPTKSHISPVAENEENVDSDSEQSSNMDAVDNDNQEHHDDPIDVNRDTIRSRKDLVIDSDKGKKVSTKNSGESLYPRVPSFDSTKLTPLRDSNVSMVEASQPPSTQGDAEIIEYVRRVGRESLAKKQAMVSDDLYTSKSPFRFAKQRVQVPTRTPNRSSVAGLNSVGRRPFSRNLSPGSPGSEQQTKRRKTVEPSANEMSDRFGTPQFPFTPSEARRIMENIESISSPFSEAKRSTTTSSSLRQSSTKRSILLEDDIAPPTKALSVPLSLPGLPYSKSRRAVSKAPSRLSEVSEFLSSVNEKKKKISQQLEAKKSIESDVSNTTDSNSTDELSANNATTVEDHSPSKTDFSFGSPVALSDIKAPSLPVEFKRTEVEKPVDESSHTLKKYSLKMKTFSTRQHGSSNRFSARDEDLDSGEEDETLKTIAPAPLLNTSGGFGFATPKTPSVTTTNFLGSATSDISTSANKTPQSESDKGSSILGNTEAFTSAISSAPSLGNTEVKSSTLSGFSFGSLSPSVTTESLTTDKSASVLTSPETPSNIPTQTKLAGFSFGNSISSTDVSTTEKSEVTNSGFSFSSPKKSEKPAGFSFGSSPIVSEDKSSTSELSNKDVSGSTKPSFGSLGGTSSETVTSSKPGFSFSSPAIEEIKTPTFAFGTSDKTEPKLTNNQLDTNATKDKNEHETKTPSFSFGAPSVSVPSKPVASESATPSNPTFTFGTPVANDKPLGFGSQVPASSTDDSTANKPEETQPKSTGFTFGAPSTTPSGPPEPKASGFTFGGASTSLTNKPVSDVPTFSFGTNDSTPTNTSEPKSGFSFGGVKAATGEEGSKIAGFTFGDSAASSNSTEPKPSGFSFNSTNTSDAKTTSFSFGAPASQSEESTLVASTNTPVDSKSTFTFGTPAASSSSSQPGFTFGTPTTQTAKPSSFSFGAPSSTVSETPKANEDKPAFGGFGTTDSKSSFTFGTSTAGTSTPAFGGFGASQPSTTVDSKPAPFAFGSANTQAQPSGFTFGAPATQATTFSTTTPSQATPAPFTFGTSNSNDAMSSTPPTGFGGFGANSSTPAATTPNPPAPFAFGSSNSSGPSTATGFSFGASTSQPPSMSFGGSNSGANTSSFAFGSTSTTGFGASSAQPQPQTTAFGANSNSNFSFGASQPAASQPSTFAFGSGNGQAGSAPGNGFNFNGTPSQPAPFAFGASTPAAQPSFGFNGTPASAAQPAAPGGFNMGSSTVPAGRKIARPKRRTR
ncbi:hypothetical protein K7432_000511 [Basidiobolus ranarum]|uniref:Uncharacterized protein n=1 Tax=Basidiobolus ranarum TaxID=34480 RepID=A0ABR2X4G9_9FUNG